MAVLRELFHWAPQVHLSPPEMGGGCFFKLGYQNLGFSDLLRLGSVFCILFQTSFCRCSELQYLCPSAMI